MGFPPENHADAAGHLTASAKPNPLDGLSNLATLFVRQRNYKAAEECYRRVLKAQPESAESLSRLGTVKKLQGQLPAAIDCYRRALTLQPACAEFHFNLAITLQKQGAFMEAVESYHRALALQPDDFRFHFGLGVALHEMGDTAAAAASYRFALRLNPKCASAYTNLGALCQELGDLDTAAALQRQALRLSPDMLDAHVNMGVVYSKQGNMAEAIACFQRALAQDPNYAAAHCNLGFALAKLGDLRGAEGSYRRALACQPDLAIAQVCLATTHMVQGNLAAGWPEYEARWKTSEFRAFRRSFAQPLWRGEALHGARILLHAEQGLGDTIQFVRYAPAVAALGGEVILEVQPQLRRFLDHVPGVTRTITRGEPFPEFAWQCPLLSLPLAFQTELSSIPAKVPYLQADQTGARAWAGRLAGEGLRIGIAWAGNPKHSRDRQRSLALAQLEPLTHIKGTTFYSLQKGAAAAQLRELPATMKVHDLEAQVEDFADTAAIVANLDLVISVDTALAHLAGAMGKPVWILLHCMPDWRWLLNREDSLWYPTARLFRQTTPDNWQGVIDRLRMELEGIAG
jgi:tetratricopeptide (TPR) repeat protein